MCIQKSLPNPGRLFYCVAASRGHSLGSLRPDDDPLSPTTRTPAPPLLPPEVSVDWRPNTGNESDNPLPLPFPTSRCLCERCRITEDYYFENISLDKQK